MIKSLRFIGAVLRTYRHFRVRGHNRRQAMRRVIHAVNELFDLWLLEGIELQARKNQRKR